MRRVLALGLLALLVAVAVAPGVAAAERRAGGGVVVGPNESVSGLTATGGTVTVYGTVRGDLDAYAGSVVIGDNATVTGTVTVYAGSVRIDGTVEGRVVAYGGSVVQSPSSTIGRSFGILAGDATVAGTVRGDVTAGVGTLRLAPTARIRGDVTYDGELVDEGAQVGGQVRHVSDLDVGPTPQDLPPGTFVVYGLLSNLLLGAVLLYGVGGFSRAVVEGVVLDAPSSLRHGLAVAVATPLVVLGLVLTVVGIPVALVGVLALPAVGWVGAVYGRFAVGAWLLSYADRDDPRFGLVAGVVLVGLLGLVPYVGPVVRGLVLLLGVGAVAAELRDRIAGDWGR